MSKVNFLTYEQCAERFRGKSVAIIGSGLGEWRNAFLLVKRAFD